MMWGWGPDGWGWGAWLVMSLFMVVFWGLVIWAVVMLVRYSTARRPEHGDSEPRPDPEKILDERFARGEINEDEYRKRREVLRGSG